MQRKPSKKTRGITVKEKKFMVWVKSQPCIQCFEQSVIVEHMYGSTFKHNRVLIGMVALLPLCDVCDSVKTNGSHRAYLQHFGETQAQSFTRLMKTCPDDIKPSPEEIAAIEEWNR